MYPLHFAWLSEQPLGQKVVGEALQILDGHIARNYLNSLNLSQVNVQAASKVGPGHLHRCGR